MINNNFTYTCLAHTHLHDHLGVGPLSAPYAGLSPFLPSLSSQLPQLDDDYDLSDFDMDEEEGGAEREEL